MKNQGRGLAARREMGTLMSGSADESAVCRNSVPIGHPEHSTSGLSVRLAGPDFLEDAAEVAAKHGFNVGVGVLAPDQTFSDVERTLGDIEIIKV